MSPDCFQTQNQFLGRDFDNFTVPPHLGLDMQHLLERSHTLFSLSFLPEPNDGVHQGQPDQQHTRVDLANDDADYAGRQQHDLHIVSETLRLLDSSELAQPH